MSSDKDKITYEDLKRLKDALSPVYPSKITVLENDMLPDNTIVMSKNLFEQLKKDLPKSYDPDKFNDMIDHGAYPLNKSNYTTCPQCDGTGDKKVGREDCPTCQGTGVIKNPTKS